MLAKLVHKFDCKRLTEFISVADIRKVLQYLLMFNDNLWVAEYNQHLLNQHIQYPLDNNLVLYDLFGTLLLGATKFLYQLIYYIVNLICDPIVVIL